MSTPSIQTRAALTWKTLPRNLLLPQAAERFRYRMVEKIKGDREGAESLAQEVLEIAAPLFHPVSALVDLKVDAITPESVVLGGRELPGGRWTKRLGRGDAVRLYCLSAGGRQSELSGACGGDSILESALHLFGCEVVFSINKHFSHEIHTDGWQTVGLYANYSGNATRSFDPALVRSMYLAFSGPDSPVRVTDGGSFDPVHTVLGLLGRRGAGRGGDSREENDDGT